MNINRDYVSLETKFCSVCVFLIVTASRLAFRSWTTLIEITVYPHGVSSIDHKQKHTDIERTRLSCDHTLEPT